MSLIDRLKSVYRWLARFAEAMEFDPLDDLRRRVERLERQGVKAVDPEIKPERESAVR